MSTTTEFPISLLDRDRVRRCPKSIATFTTSAISSCEDGTWEEIKKNYSPVNVFVNVPYDKEYSPLLGTIITTLQYAGMQPVVASQRSDGAWYRLCKICELMQTAKYVVSDLSISRLHNIPFELGFATALGRISHIFVLFHKKQNSRGMRLYDAQLSNMKSVEVIFHENDQMLLARELLRRIETAVPEAREIISKMRRSRSTEQRLVQRIVDRTNKYTLKRMKPADLDQMLKTKRAVIEHGLSVFSR